jgi:hypothetical protein
MASQNPYLEPQSSAIGFRLDRRKFLALTAGALMSSPARSFAQAACGDGDIAAIKPLIQRAVSLRQVTQALADGKRVNLQGLTRLDGYVVDEENGDIGLIGLAEKDQPELETADFVVALRSAFLRGTHDGVNYDNSAAISLDPNPDVFRRLHGIGIAAAGGQQQYREVCRSPQTVRVDGMVRDSRVAKILVDADYRMKQVSQGTAKLPLGKPFTGDWEAKIVDWRNQIRTRGKTDGAGSLTRYWFTPGQFGYVASDDGGDTVFLDRAQVLLKDEAQVLPAAGEAVASGGINPYARAFTCAWTASMEESYRAEPLWRQMYNMYRHFAVARIMAETGVFNRVKVDLAFLLERYRVPGVGLPATLPGLSRIETQATGRGGSTFAFAVCGGVQVGLHKISRSNDADGIVQRAGNSVLASRPAGEVLAWNIAPGTLMGVFKKKPASPAAGNPPESAAAPKSSLKDLFPPVTTEKPLAAPSLRDLFKA